MELADSEARTKDGDLCVGKDEILKITNKRRLYDFTGPLEAMGLIETTKINIIWTGCRIGSFSFVPVTCRNVNMLGRNCDELAKFGRRADLPLPRPPKNIDANIPKMPKKKKADSEIKERLRFLIKRKSLLLAELREKELSLNKRKPLGVSYTNICIGVQLVI